MRNTPAPNLLSVITKDFRFERGHPMPMGSSIIRGGINFALFSRNATKVTLVLFLPGVETEIAAFPLDETYNRTGDVWHAFVGGLNHGIEYGYRIEGPDYPPHNFKPNLLMADPYAIALNGTNEWGNEEHKDSDTFRRAILVNREYDWEFDQPINRPLSDSIIYEMHVRGFTQDKSSKVQHPGTFKGVIDKIPYLKELGVTAIELLPVTEFDELDNDRTNPLDNDTRLHNFWGYHPLSFFAPKAGYSSSNVPGSEVSEFKDMVKALHAAGIEIILDVVFNHSGEGDHRGPTISFKGVDSSIYYMMTPDHNHMNFSGCGNTINCNHPHVRNFILASLRYWVTEMHVDGFRFDLASILGRDQDGSVLASPPLLEQIAGDPVLADTKLIAEAWDAAGLYQVGSFPNWGRWAEWNGRFRDDIRGFVRGETAHTKHLATRLAGSADLYQSERDPGHGINFITSHDGFSLADLVAYNDKHNDANGENNNDGDNHNLSWNCGVEGKTDDPEILALRDKQIRNLATLLMLSRGVPMILSGDEMGRSQNGNNNAYCQDSKLSWMDWGLLQKNRSIYRFFQLLIEFRKNHELLRHNSFEVSDGQGAQITWHGQQLGRPDWGDESRSLAMHLAGRTENGDADDIYLITNSHWEGCKFDLPQLHNKQWFRFVDTSLDGDSAITGLDNLEPLIHHYDYSVSSRSTVVLLAKAMP